jgi:hypothetical protein
MAKKAKPKVAKILKQVETLVWRMHEQAHQVIDLLDKLK